MSGRDAPDDDVLVSRAGAVPPATGAAPDASATPSGPPRRASVKLWLTIPLLVIAAAVVTGLAVAVADYTQASRELRRGFEDKLLALLQARTIAISDYLSSIQRDLRQEASDPLVIEAIARFTDARAAFGPDAAKELHRLYVDENPHPIQSRSRLDDAGDGSAYSAVHARFHPRFRDFTDRYGYRDMLLINLDGDVVYSVKKQDDFASELVETDGDGLYTAFRQAVANAQSGKEVFVDFAPYQPAGGEPTGFVAMTVFDESRMPIGVLALGMPVDRINRVMQVAAGLGLTGETLIVGQDLLLRSASRLDSRSTILDQRIDIDAIKAAFTGVSGLSVSDERNQDGSVTGVLVAALPLDFLGTRWVIAAKADLNEVDAPVSDMGRRALINGAIIALAVAMIGFVITRFAVVRPLTAVVNAIGALTGGDRDAPLGLPGRRDEIGDVSRALVLFRDSLIERDRLADENQREAMMAEAGRRFRAIAEANPIAVLVANRSDGAIRYANPMARSLLGLPDEDPLEAKIADFLADPGEFSALVESGNRERTDGQESRIRRPDGSEVPVAVSARALDYDGQPSLVLGLLDLTDKQAAEIEIERQREMIYQSEKLGALGALLAGVAHELNNPLSVVVAQATLLQELAPDAKTASRGEKIRLAAERCARIVKTFLAMARQKPPSRSTVDLNQVIAAAIELLGYSLRTAGIDVRADLDRTIPAIWADPDQISQVLINLIVNAQQALAESSGQRNLTVATCVDPRDGMIRLTVTDSGPGVPPAIRSRIFEPFFTTKPVGMGTGIGLSVCHGVVTAHGGTITVDDAPGGGAVFEIRLPATTTVEAAAPAGPAPDLIGAGGRALVVDDEPAVAESLSDILRHAGYRIDIAESGEAALDRVRTGVYDVIFSDVHMPDMDGLTFCRNLRELRPELADRLVFVTGDMLGGNIRTFIEETGLPFLEKPFMPAEVRRLAAETVRRRARSIAGSAAG
jgi:PAS domain S-box-containing protein